MINRILTSFFNLNIVYTLYKFKVYYLDRELLRYKERILLDKLKNKGVDLRIHGDVTIKGHDNLIIGDYVRIGNGCYFSCSGGLKIGDNTQISRNVVIYTNSHDIESTAIPYDNSYTYKPVSIGHSVWIGMNVTIVPGTTIGDGAVIGMGTVVSGAIPDCAIVVGQKHRIIGYRDSESFQSRKHENRFFGKLYPHN